MSKAMQLVGIILLGIFTLVVVYLMSDVRSTNELDYYLLQEVTEASMYDAVDYSYYRETGLLKVDRDMFLENFNRRFAESVDNNREYNIKIIDFNETPPKVSVEVTAPTVASVRGEVALVTNRVSGIIETIYDDYVYSRGGYGLDNYDDEAPNIEVSDSNNNVYTITMTDNYMLDKYAIVNVGTNGSNKFTESTYRNITDWKYINDFVASYTTRTEVPNGTIGVWVVAVDRGGLWTAVPITDIKPWIAEWAYNPESEGTLDATFKDDRGLSTYELTPVKCNGSASVDVKGSASCNGSWSGNGSTKTVDITNPSVTNDGYYTKTIRRIDISGSDYYELAVKDNKGQYSNKIYIQGNRKHEIKITHSVAGNKLTATITDSYGDLTSYKITTNSSTPNSWDTATRGDKITIGPIGIDTSKTYYIHAKDSSGKTVKSEVKIISNKVLADSSYTIKNGCSGVWKDGNSEGCFSDANGQSWQHNDNTIKEFQVDTNNYSKISISVSNLKFNNMSKLSSAPNCPSIGWCRFSLKAIIGGKEVVIKSWGILHQSQVKTDTEGCILTGNTNSGTVVIDLNELGIKNTGNQTLQLKIESGINGLFYFEGNVNNITLKN